MHDDDLRPEGRPRWSHDAVGPMEPPVGEYEAEIEVSRSAPATYAGADLGLPIAGPGSLGARGDRVWGYVIDGFVLVPLLIVFRVIADVTHLTSADGRGTAGALLLLVPPAVYVIVAIGVFGQTLGQRAMNLEVIRIDGSPIDWDAAVRRWILLGVLGVVGALTGMTGITGTLELVVLWWMFFDRDRQGLHDKLAGVVVVRAARRTDGEHP